jgi:hypothetical protein
MRPSASQVNLPAVASPCASPPGPTLDTDLSDPLSEEVERRQTYHVAGAATENVANTSCPDAIETSSEISEISENEDDLSSPTPQGSISDELACSFYPTPSTSLSSLRRKASSCLAQSHSRDPHEEERQVSLF